MQYLETRRQYNLLYFFHTQSNQGKEIFTYVWFQLHDPRILNIFGRNLCVRENTSD